MILQWLDITAVRQAKANLLANEHRFRGMIEQNLTGICVVQDQAIVYCNPRLSEIVGWRVDELIGTSVSSIFHPDPDTQENITRAKKALYAGPRSVQLTVPCHTKDGRAIVIGVHGSQGVWDGRQATVLMLQDVTERQRAEEKISAYVKQLEGSVRGTLQAVANMVELRDPYTAGHERRVGLISCDIAREMGWPEERCQAMQLIGLVHDIGKIACPAEILSKPTRLTPLEYAIIQTHAERGYEILKDVDSLLPIAEIIRSHHERMNGSGYPQGLKGDQILPESRVLAVADVLESMASHRPYRPALGVAVALKEIVDHRGVWFDVEVVDALLRLINEKGYRLPD